MKQPRRVLGLDPGTAITGYGIVCSEGQSLTPVIYGVITTSPALALPLRLQQLHDALRELINTYHPPAAAVEELYFARNARTALAVGHARGVILLALAEAGLETYSYTPLEVKKAITGYGRADKEQVQQMVRLLLSLEAIPQPDDAADALAVAICHAHSSAVTARLSRFDAGGEGGT
jgi:crossover junction endodeoxyribonuclease RuvC